MIFLNRVKSSIGKSQCRPVLVTGLSWLCLASAGCQSWAPGSGLPGMIAKRNHGHLAKIAAQDPFPSPSDVGLSDASDNRGEQAE